ncbi:hypothetical protein [Elizabethkingia anophelis]|uniref:Uncharacterized protein n=1 Tax=Elizabethkingia anophelis NUHP1 TaxID=1338011 RepID=A0A077EH93_9FLAO|nr:hypothetical protein [Elizabethkingia anophelis]AIL46812.1 hypothetical protein BD94_3037 [Elizabethkingia anophelis NUHP1]EHM7982744.1 hypothetical protein [Elizabethkingia anophelis]EHM8032421.1 hypothetical protein [Elizabethkingia anophelis]EHZ9535391.1 hypothetical protein [Elizabethkingia anophelis]EKU3673301.1 hypothetical protein [Elizabethkingia anophelis]
MVFWIDVFTRMEYFDIIINALDYYRKNIDPWEWKYSSARNYCDDYQEIFEIDLNL